MRLTGQEFARIRPLQWVLREYGGVAYNSPADQTSTRLFWLDFMRYVFAPKYAAQRGVTSINRFDTTQPVLLSDDLNLKLPTMLETAMYFANNQTLPSQTFAFDWPNRTAALMLAVIIYVALAVFHYYYYSAASTARGKLYTAMHKLATAKVI